jgi:hypothetical protein
MDIDSARTKLRDTGWSTGDIAVSESGKLVWSVFCHRGETKLVVRGVSRTEAWTEAVKMAAEADR